VIKSITEWLNHKGAPCHVKVPARSPPPHPLAARRAPHPPTPRARLLLGCRCTRQASPTDPPTPPSRPLPQKFNLGYANELCEQRLFAALGRACREVAVAATARGDYELAVSCEDAAGDAVALTKTPGHLTVELLGRLLDVPEGATVGKNIASPLHASCQGSLATLARLLHSRGATLAAPAAPRPARGRRAPGVPGAPAPAPAHPAAERASAALRALSHASTCWVVSETYRGDGGVRDQGPRKAFELRDPGEGDDRAPLPGLGQPPAGGDTDPPDGGGGFRGRGGSDTPAHAPAAPVKTPRTVRRTPREADAAPAPAGGRASVLPAGADPRVTALAAAPAANTPASDAWDAPCDPLALEEVEPLAGFEQLGAAGSPLSDDDDDAVVPRSWGATPTLSPLTGLAGRKRPREWPGDDRWGAPPAFTFYAAVEPVQNISVFQDAAGTGRLAPCRPRPGGHPLYHRDAPGADGVEDPELAGVLADLHPGESGALDPFQLCLEALERGDRGGTPPPCGAGSDDDGRATPMMGVGVVLECYSGRSSPAQGAVGATDPPGTEEVRAAAPEEPIWPEAGGALAGGHAPAFRSRRNSFTGNNEDGFGHFTDLDPHCD